MDKRNRRDHILKSIGGMRHYKYGWNGDSSLPIRTDVRNWSYELFARNASFPLIVPDNHLEMCPYPDVTLNDAGTVSIAFVTEGRQLILTIQCRGIVTYIKLFDDDQTTVSGVIRLDTEDLDADLDMFAEFQELFIWLIRE